MTNVLVVVLTSGKELTFVVSNPGILDTLSKEAIKYTWVSFKDAVGSKVILQVRAIACMYMRD